MDFDFGIIINNIPYLSKGLLYTIQVTIVAMLGGVFLGTLLALMRLSKSTILQAISLSYVLFFRSIPLVLVLFTFFLFIPAIIGQPIGADRSAYITFILFEAAYYSEIMRAGIQSIGIRQQQASYALGLNYTKTMRYIILPQAFRNSLPVLLTQTIILFQDVSLVYVIGATDFLGAADKLNQRDFRPIELYSFVAVIYLIICSLLSWQVRRLQEKIKILR
jgi:glutamate/aspartate transport system permease protein